MDGLIEVLGLTDGDIEGLMEGDIDAEGDVLGLIL